ncbi:MAG: STT3 domain-containing protein [archaeon]|nr:STT3 domain-containing protein [archaeon]
MVSEDNNLDKKRDELLSKFKNVFSSNASSESQSNDDLSFKREDLLKTLHEKKNLLVYLALAAIIWIGYYIRTRNLTLLIDRTTGTYIPIALDPHLFTKYARYIVEHGTLLVRDMTRFVPEGIITTKSAFMSYFIAYLYKILHAFDSSVTLEFASVIYPVITFVIGMVFFFLLIRKLFDWKVGLISSLFLVVVPAFLQRTMAGFSDHEALGMMFTFMVLYFYVLGWKKETMKSRLGWGLLAGVTTGLNGLTWGGWKFVVLILGLFVLVEFFFNKTVLLDLWQYGAWIFGFVISSTTFIPVFSLGDLLSSFTTGIAFLVLFVLIVDEVLYRYNPGKIKEKVGNKLPRSIVSFTISAIIGLIAVATVLGGTDFLTEHLGEISNSLLHPLGNDRWELTVAEQYQPYFTDWTSHFGPNVLNFPVYIILFILGSVIAFYSMVRKHKERLWMTLVYVVFILAFILSRYSPSSKFNGTNSISILVYIGSLVAFGILAAWFYLKSYYKDRSTYEKIITWEKRYILILVWFIVLVVAARGASRLFFVFAPITALMAGYAINYIREYFVTIKNKKYRYVAIILLLFVLLSPLASPKGLIPAFYETSLYQGTYSGPSYTPQWQVAGQWVRENIPEDAVFGHWWDYGYWVQNGFQRSTVLDGQNKIKYWNYLMGRHVLTGQTQNEALEFLKVHDATHFLIISDEIGKYTAYSSIGSDENYDRYSWITTFVLNPQGTKETRDSMVYFYQGGYALDDDFTWEGQVFPKQGAGIGAVLLPIDQKEVEENGEVITTASFQRPEIVIVSNGKQTNVPLTCIFAGGEIFLFDGPGYDGCLRLIPTLKDDGSIDNPIGAGTFISEEGRKALWVNLFLFEGKNPKFDTSAFNIVYNDDSTYAPLSIYKGRLIGPLKIWEINYPEGFTVDEETTKRYLGGNELLPDYFFDVN